MSRAAPQSGLRVLHVTEFVQGGVATYLNELLPEQARLLGAGAVTVVAPGAHRDLLTGDGYRFVPYRRTGRNVGSFVRLVRAFRRELRRERPDVVHIHLTFTGLLVRLALLTTRPRPAVVYCAHGWAFLRETSGPMQRGAALAERALAPLTDAIVSISNTEHRAALDAGLSPSRCRVIRHGLGDAPARSVHEPAAPSSNGAGADDGAAKGSTPLRLLFLGRHDRQKGLDLLLEAFAALDPTRFTLTVAGAAALERRNATAIPRGVTAVGWCSPREVDELLLVHDAVVVPSRWEGFGFVALEAMRRGLAVVASARGSLPELVEDGVTGWLFDPAEPGALRSCLAALNPAAVAEAGRLGRARFEEQFRSTRMVGETMALYQELRSRPAQQVQPVVLAGAVDRG